MDKLKDYFFYAMGQASMCWSERPKGVFDDVMAVKVGLGVMAAIEEYVNEEIKKDRAKQHLTTPHIIRDANGHEIARMKGFEVSPLTGQVHPAIEDRDEEE